MNKYTAIIYESKPDKYNSIYTVIEITNNENNKTFFLEPPFLSGRHITHILHKMDAVVDVNHNCFIRFVKGKCKTAVHCINCTYVEQIIKENIG